MAERAPSPSPEPATDTLLRAVINGRDEASAVITATGTIRFANKRFATVLPNAPSLDADEDALLKHLGSRNRTRLLSLLAAPPGPDGDASRFMAFDVPVKGSQGPGSIIWLEATALPKPDQAGVLPDWLITLRPEAAAPAAIMSAHGSDVAGLISARGRIQSLSRSAARILRCDASVLIGDSLVSIAVADDRDALQAAVDQATKQSEIVETRFRLAWSGTEDRHIQLTVYPDTNGWGDPDDLAIIMTDVTVLIALEHERDRAVSDAQKASQTKSRFLAGMSHELRTPLNAIIGFSGILQAEMFGPLGSERYRDYAHLIGDSGTVLLELISDILDLARIESGRYMLRLEDIDLAGLVEECARPWLERAKAKNLLVEIALPPGRPHLKGDKMALSQILTNLLSNAVKYSEDGGRITVAVEDEAGGYLTVHVMDTGVGIPPDMVPKLGRPFEQVVAENSMHGGSNGIGLALVNALVGLHKGRWRIESVPGEGTTVSVTVPKKQAGAKEPADREAA